MYQVLQFIALLIVKLIQLIQPLLVPLCFLLAWGLLAIIAWQMITAFRDGFQRAQTMHQIPCADCRYFTDNHLLKCPVHPDTALSEDAIGCTDFERS